MSLPIEDLTPRQIVAELNRYIVGQSAAKRAIAVALRNRYRRQQLPAEERNDVMPKNILMIGPTGVGKTEIARRLAQLARAPFIKVEATKFTEVGYVGRDVESMVRDLVSAAVRLVETERFEAVRPEAEEAALDRLVDLLDDEPSYGHVAPRFHPGFEMFGEETEREEEEIDYEALERANQERREKLRAEVQSGSRDSDHVEFEIEEASNPFLQVFTPQGIEEMGLDGMNLGGMGGTKRRIRRATVAEARETLIEQESKKLIDHTSLHRDAIHRAEQTGIIFLDEIDKIAGKSGGSGPDVSREGVQRDLLPIIEGGTVATKFGPVKTDHVLFVAAGAFHISKPSDLIPELQGRLPIRVELESLSMDDFRRILVEPKNALTRQYQLLLRTEGVEIEFTEDALDEIANIAAAVNEKTEDIGARRLHTIMERLLEDVLFEAPDSGEKRVVWNREKVQAKLQPYLTNLETSRKIL
jgi:ATP-dependent HslUV protease ATP-binding subunit HslU